MQKPHAFLCRLHSPSEEYSVSPSPTPSPGAFPRVFSAILTLQYTNVFVGPRHAALTHCRLAASGCCRRKARNLLLIGSLVLTLGAFAKALLVGWS